jgi:hypothetical protein
VPGPEVLGASLDPGGLAQIVVDQRRQHRLPRPLLLVGQKSRVVRTSPAHDLHGLDDPPIVDLDPVGDAGLADEAEY